MNHADAGSLSATTPAGFTFTAAADFKPDVVFASGTPHELRITPAGLTLRGESITDAGQLYHALMTALGQGAESVTFFRNRGSAGIWVEADKDIIDIIEKSPSTYELRVMHSRPRGVLSRARLEQLAREYDLEVNGQLYSFAVAVRDEP